MTHWLTLTNEIEVVVPSISKITALLPRVLEFISTLALIFNYLNLFFEIFNNYFYFLSTDFYNRALCTAREKEEVVESKKFFAQVVENRSKSIRTFRINDRNDVF